MRTWRLSGSESHTGLRARMQWPQVQTQPPAKSNCSHWTQDCLFHSTREDTHDRRITAHARTRTTAESQHTRGQARPQSHSTREDTHDRRVTAHARTRTTAESHAVGTPGPAHICLCMCTHPPENVCAPVAMCVCRSTQTHVSTHTTAESQTHVSTRTTSESQTHVSTRTTTESQTRVSTRTTTESQTCMSTRTTAESQTRVAGRHGLAHVDVHACGHVHTGVFMPLLPCRSACVGRQ